MQGLTPSRPYLLRAYYDWLMDNHLTPHVVVDAFVPGTEVPQQYVKDGQIVLNITASAVGNLQITNEFVEFNARFGGVPQQVVLPMAAIVAIYARENGAGTVFDVEDAYSQTAKDKSAPSISETPTQESKSIETPKSAKKTSHLTLVK
ncbi:ClpXP protease specificity-enhancing factor [Shewanella gelidii]|uniref:Stringent starvation protein B n=1 Tax=Shewanella gelidii TaxID=1642821 RepID=A0A917JNY9_9GAMM|nr:ClpXP protease specificity-enhancing factor [Shewanella gelidii]MCL1097753.1 ClpXP protease specificity-enhancing factor [Shewanella gelidii]GGI79070.1 stringent starvation protein B [Shewanella gelidii]